MSLPRDFSDIRFDDFQRLAKEPGLSKYERIGFPDSYRKGYESLIFSDILSKLPALKLRQQRVLDIGPGCSELPHMLLKLCEEQGHQLSLIDGQAMLAQLPEQGAVEKIDALFPRCKAWIEAHLEKMDLILCYSVLHYAFVDTDIFGFLDALLSLLAPGGRALLGDIPNLSMRRRFFSSARGEAFHREFMKTDQKPELQFNRLEAGKIDDAVIFGLLQRARDAGFHAYVLPQDPALPMANRREDILLERP